MPTFIELTPDPFNQSFDNSVQSRRGTTNGSGPTGGRLARRGFYEGVRRPVRGLQIKDDTYAQIQVIASDGSPKLLIDSGNGGVKLQDATSQTGFTTKYSNFLLQSVQEARQEKVQVVETFGEPYIFFYGEHPRIVQMTGILINSEDFNWRAEWWENYDQFLRGTKCAQTKTRVLMTWDDIVVMGYMMQCQASEQATDPLQVAFSFNLFLTHYENISNIGETEFPRGGVEVNLDPNTLDPEGLSSGFTSSTLLVRNLNTSSNGLLPLGSSSLLDTIRNGITQASNIYTNADSWLSGSIDQATDLLSGRLIRVPVGFQGGSVFDDLGLSQGSVDPAALQVLGIQANLGGRTFTIKAPRVAQTFQQAIYGSIPDNTDEFIARVTQTNPSGQAPPNLFADQLSADNAAGDQVRLLFKKFGISVDPPNDLVIGAISTAFRVAAIGVGAGILQRSNDPSSTVNEAGSLVMGLI